MRGLIVELIEFCVFCILDSVSTSFPPFFLLGRSAWVGWSVWMRRNGSENCLPVIYLSKTRFPRRFWSGWPADRRTCNRFPGRPIDCRFACRPPSLTEITLRIVFLRGKSQESNFLSRFFASTHSAPPKRTSTREETVEKTYLQRRKYGKCKFRLILP